MPDLTLQPMRQCVSWHSTMEIQSDSQPSKFYEVIFRGPEQGAFCPCLAYKFSAYPHDCKHIRQAQTKTCLWNQQWSPEVLNRHKPDVCPKCNEKTEVVMIGV